MVVYGVKGYVPNVDPSVFDAAFVIENGKMLMVTDIDLKGYHTNGAIYYLHGVVNTNDGK